MSARQFDRVTTDEAFTMLTYIPADDRDLWVKLGGVLKDEFGDDGFGIWDAWSTTSDSYREKDALAVWRSLGRAGRRAGIGTLVHLARKHGWRAGERPRPAPAPTSRPAPRAAGRDLSAYAAELWLAASFDDEAVTSHPYARRKGIESAGGARRGQASGRVIGSGADCLIVPIYAGGTGKLQGVQCINAEGAKQTFGPATGGCLLLGNTLNRAIPWYVAEGWASAYSVVFHHKRGDAVCAVAFGKHNQRAVAVLLADAFQPDAVDVLLEEDA
jgi:hypothetical protein